ncbi:MAG: Spy/CpxP family protein refolding chaperone [Desulfuromonadaceae bacterium]|nr:Spy/CpxP family protein refolding chaperone [Desulfuromonadaceae bacterium]
MKRRVYQIIFPVALVVVMATFLSTIFLADANPSYAASAKKKSPAVARTSAVEHTEARIKQLQGSLNITESQEVLWSNLTQVMRENAKEMDALIKERSESSKSMNAVEHMKFHGQNTEAHLNQMKRLIPPFEALYDSMTDEQKKITDTIFKTGKDGRNKKKK